jgi:molybdopterin-biosynthesis enzyme MoeA-like protein
MAEIGQEVTPARLELGTYPAGSRIVPNPFNRIPGFSYADHHFLPGFPQMAWPMAEWVLDTYYRERFQAGHEAEAAIAVLNGHEGLLLDLMQRIERDYPGVKVFSLPTAHGNAMPGQLELGVRGLPDQVPPAMAEIEAEVTRRGLAFERK